MGKKFEGIVVVHLGAGFHAPDSEKELKKLIAAACDAGVKGLMAGKSAVEAVAQTISILEVS